MIMTGLENQVGRRNKRSDVVLDVGFLIGGRIQSLESRLDTRESRLKALCMSSLERL